jgi:hypothetical protein
MKRFFGKRRATRSALGELKTQPFGRLGALVFQPDNSDKLYWASLWAQTRIAGCALSRWPKCHPLEKRFLRKMGSQLAENQAQNNGGCADRKAISFSLLTVFAEHSKVTPDSRSQRLPGADASAIHGRTERSGCTAAEPYPLSRKIEDTLSTASP